jgi:dolichol-phosphate mannosyltransferase
MNDKIAETVERESRVLPTPSVAVVIPCYKAAATIPSVLDWIGPEVSAIYCVDDASPDDTVAIVTQAMTRDDRIRLILRPANGGVGAAMVDGYRAAIADGATVVVKIDSDGQMNPALISSFVAPILSGEADYVKGNRFFAVDTVRGMPPVRIIGNAGLSFLTKLSTGYWELFDPTNGYTAIHADVAAVLPLERLHARYFFESDLLFRLSTVRARVTELPMVSTYGDERSHLNVLRCLVTFPWLHVRNFLKRLFYNYFLRNFNIASVNILVGTVLVAFGLLFGIDQWLAAARSDLAATPGTVMLSALPFLLGVQFILNFLSHDMATTPREAIHHSIAKMRVLPASGSSETLSHPAALASTDLPEREAARPLKGNMHV